MKTLNANELVSLESMIDRTSLATVLQAISEMCGYKASHIEENWPATGSQTLALDWERAGDNVMNAATASSVQRVSK